MRLITQRFKHRLTLTVNYYFDLSAELSSVNLMPNIGLTLFLDRSYYSSFSIGFDSYFPKKQSYNWNSELIA
jgi:hypothetical protein